jgi:hypothetical protein
LASLLRLDARGAMSNTYKDVTLTDKHLQKSRRAEREAESNEVGAERAKQRFFLLACLVLVPFTALFVKVRGQSPSACHDGGADLGASAGSRCAPSPRDRKISLTLLPCVRRAPTMRCRACTTWM